MTVNKLDYGLCSPRNIVHDFPLPLRVINDKGKTVTVALHCKHFDYVTAI